MNVLLEKTINTNYAVKLKNIKDLKKGDLIPLVSDSMFKIIFGSESKKKFVAYFLSLIIKEDAKEIEDNMEFIKNELDQESYSGAKRSVDIVIRLDGKIYNIEMNNNSTIASLERNIDYANKIYSSSRRRGKSYKYEYVYQININNFTFEGEERTMDEFEIMSMYDKNKSLTNKIHFVYFYLPKMLERYYNGDELNELEKFLIILNSTHEEEFSDLEEDEIMEEARDAIARASDTYFAYYDAKEDADWLYHAEMQEMERNGIKKGKEEGIKEGIEKATIENAKSFIKIGTPLEDISKALGLNIEELKEIQNNL